MSLNLPTKSSSRSGRFKKKLVGPQELQTEAPLIEAKMAPILELFHQGQITAPELTACYIIAVLSQRFPGTWMGAKSPSLFNDHRMPFKISGLSSTFKFEPNIQKRLQSVTTLGELFAHFALRSTPLSVNRSLLEWSIGRYGLELMFRIPTPHEVLLQQKVGRRCVTMLTKKEETSQYILGERDALSFSMHDLIHADHFYKDKDIYEGQLGFYGLLEHCYREGHFNELWGKRKFRDEFEYLISDMNAYAIHLMKCLKAAMIHYHPEGQVYFKAWLSKLNLTEEQNHALEILNTDNYQAEEKDQVLLAWLQQWKSVAVT